MTRSLSLIALVFLSLFSFSLAATHSVDVNGKYKYVFLKMEKNCRASDKYPNVVDFTERDARDFDMIVQLVGKNELIGFNLLGDQEGSRDWSSITTREKWSKRSMWEHWRLMRL